MSDKKTRARIKELHAVIIQCRARAYEAADAGRHMDAQQHMRRANERVFEGLQAGSDTDHILLNKGARRVRDAR